MTKAEQIDKYLEKAGVFFLITLADGKPKSRVLGFHMHLNEQVYFYTCTFKPAYRQMQENPWVEIAAGDDEGFLRYDGRVVFDDNPALLERACQVNPYVQYDIDAGYTLAFFHLVDATAEFHSATETLQVLSL